MEDSFPDLHSLCLILGFIFIITRNVDLREYLSEEVQAVHKNTTYDLIANIVHDGKPSEGSYRIHVLHHVSGKNGGCSFGISVACSLYLALSWPWCSATNRAVSG